MHAGATVEVFEEKETLVDEYTLEGTSLFLFSKDNLFRRAVHRFFKHWFSRWLQHAVVLCLFIIFAIFPTHWSAYPSAIPVYISGLTPPIPSLNETASTSGSSGSVDYGEDKQYFIFYTNIKYKILIALFTIVTLRMVLSIIERGLFFGKHAYFWRNSWNRLDLVTVPCFWIAVGLWAHGINRLPIFIAIASLYCTRALNIFEGLKKIMNMLAKVSPLLINVVSFIAFFLVFFALLGQRGFNGSMSRICVVDSSGYNNGSIATNTLTPASNAQFTFGCGQYVDPFSGEVVGAILPPGYPGDTTTTIGDLTINHIKRKGYVCPTGQICQSVLAEYNGFRSFDDFGSAFIIVVDTLACSGWSSTMYFLKGEEFPIFVPLYFVLLIVFVSFILAKLFVAVLSEAFSEEQLFRKPTSNENYAALVVESEDGWRVENLKDVAHNRLQKIALPIIKSIYWRMFWVLIVLGDVIAQATRTNSSYTTNVTPTMTHAQALDYVELAFTLMFLVEAIIKLIGLNKDFFKSTQNRVDLFLVVITCIIQIPAIHNWNGYGYFTFFQLFRFYRVLLNIFFLKNLLRKISRSLVSVVYMLLFFLSCTMCVALFAMHFLGGQYVYAEPENLYGYNVNYWQYNYNNLAQIYPPRHSFNTFLLSFLNLFRMTTGDNWEDMLYDSMQSQYFAFNSDLPGYNVVACIIVAAVFLLWWFFSKLILVNLVIAAILDNFEKDDQEKLRKQYKLFVAKAKEKKKSFFEREYVQKTLQLLGYGRVQKVQLPDLPDAYVAPLEKDQLLAFMGQVEQNVQTEAKTGKSFSSSRNILQRFVELVPRPTQNNVEMARASTEPLKGETERETVVVAGNFERVQVPVRQSLFQTDAIKSFFDNTAISALEHFIKNTVARNAAGDEVIPIDFPTQNLEKEPPLPPFDKSLGFLPRSNWFRKMCRLIVGSDLRDKQETTQDTNLSAIESLLDKPLWDWFMIVVIIVATGFLASDSPHLSQVDRGKVYFYQHADFVFMSIFLLDFALRCVADGVYLPPRAYFRSGWNVFDFALTFVLVLDAVYFRTNQTSTGIPRAFRALRGLRPLRLINQFQPIKYIFNIIMTGWRALAQALLLSGLIFFPYGIWGVNLWHGVYQSCNDGSATGIGDCIGDYNFTFNGNGQGLNIAYPVPRVWADFAYCQYDNVGQAMLCLFEDISTEGWTQRFWIARDFVDYGVQPKQDVNLHAAPIFFIPWMLIGWIMVVEIFIAIVVHNFKKQLGISLLTSHQRKWRDLQRQLSALHPTTIPPPPKEKWRAQIHKVVMDKRGGFAMFIIAVMSAHMFLFMTTFNEETAIVPKLIPAQDGISAVFIIIYIVELILKFIAMGPKEFFKSKWILYNLVVVLAAFCTVCAQLAQSAVSTEENQYLEIAAKIFIMLILLLLVQKVDKLETLFKTVISSFWPMLWITLFCVLILVSSAVLMMQIFGLTRLMNYTNPYANFQDFFNSIEMLFRTSTGESWDFVMHDLSRDTPDLCVDVEDIYSNDCGSPAWSYLCFVVFYTIGPLICVDLFLAVILDNFSYWSQSDAATSRIDRNKIRDLKKAWRDETPEGGVMNLERVHSFLHKLTGPFSVRIYDRHTFAPLHTDALFRLRAMSYYVWPERPELSAMKKIAKVHNVRNMTQEKIKEATKNWSRLRGLVQLRNVFTTQIQLIRQQRDDPGFTVDALNRQMQENRRRKIFVQLKKAYDDYYTKEVLRHRRDELNSIYLEMVAESDENTIRFETAVKVLSHRLIKGDKHLNFQERETRRLVRERATEYATMERAAGFLYNRTLSIKLRPLTPIRRPQEEYDPDIVTVETPDQSNGSSASKLTPLARQASTNLGRRDALHKKNPIGYRVSPADLASTVAVNFNERRSAAMAAMTQTSLWAGDIDSMK